MAGNVALKKQVDNLTEEQQGILEKKAADIDRLQKDITALVHPLVTKAADSWSRHVTPGTLSVFQEDSHWDGVSEKAQASLLNRGYTAAGDSDSATSWSKLLDSFGDDESLSDTDEPLSPTVTQLDINDRKTYGTMTMEEDTLIVTCKTCQRPILMSAFSAHSEACGAGVKKPRAALSATERANLAKGIFSDEDEDEDCGSSKGNTVKHEPDGQATTVPAKRPPPPPSQAQPPATEKSDKKKAKKEKQKAKSGARPKPPLDLDKQCGVLQGPNNTPCTRSLTCKSHSMGAKRAVAGRSQPYDLLLAAYQKKSIGRPQNVAGDRKGTSIVSVKGGKPGSRRLDGGSDASLAAGQEEQSVNSDEEVEIVLDAVRQSRPLPLAQKSVYFVKRRRQCYRLRDILLDTITPKDQQLAGNSALMHRRATASQQQQQLPLFRPSIAASRLVGQQQQSGVPPLGMIRIPGLTGGRASTAGANGIAHR